MMRRSTVFAMLLLTLLAGCERHETEKAAPPANATGAPTLDELKNATYSGIDALAEHVTLVDGLWQGEPFVVGGVARPRLYYARDFRLTGDLDGDGNDEAVALVGYSGGGTGELLYVTVMRREAGATDCVGAALLGDRVKIRDARVTDGRIVIDVLQVGPGDPVCCPGDLVTRVWQLTADGLVEVRTTPTGRLDVSVLAGVVWVLKWWSWDEPAPAEPEVSAVFEGIRVSGFAGCQAYSAGFRDADFPGEVHVLAVVADEGSCIGTAAEVQSRFLALFGAVQRYSFMNGMLLLEYKADGRTGTMLFERRPLSVPPQSE
ncbi:MAG: META domain-containing protein [Candidatus Krumholzibacteria bacterium]|nr:META domain-containing protein [Candidatus Krumholzibacteria bacterium]MDH4338093.1 META domain-containing protein [Candidatus Krumholzibacteria bacterium]MDH5270924.1 META domain-containing protein [Candidatus Krumholzibacteria bacterium]